MDEEIAVQGFAAMGSEARLHVLRSLVRAGTMGLAVGDIQERTGIPASTLAHHLRFLAAAGLIEQRKEGRSIISTARFDHLQDLAAYILTACCADQQSED